MLFYIVKYGKLLSEMSQLILRFIIIIINVFNYLSNNSLYFHG